MAESQTRKLNIDVTPEQEAEITWLKDQLHADTLKGTVLTSVRLTSRIAQWLEQGAELCLREPNGEVRAVAVEGIPNRASQRWKYLIRRPDEWREQLWIKGRKMLASHLWLDMLANNRNAEEAADNWSLPLDAVLEAVRYCETHEGLLKAEAEEERRQAQALKSSIVAPSPEASAA
ncbi:MAG TPA: hypothetical protein VGN26_04705 [Armatimonadota bacterium]|jgi:hypothetical protein